MIIVNLASRSTWIWNWRRDGLGRPIQPQSRCLRIVGTTKDCSSYDYLDELYSKACGIGVHGMATDYKVRTLQVGLTHHPAQPLQKFKASSQPCLNLQASRSIHLIEPRPCILLYHLQLPNPLVSIPLANGDDVNHLSLLRLQNLSQQLRFGNPSQDLI